MKIHSLMKFYNKKLELMHPAASNPSLEKAVPRASPGCQYEHEHQKESQEADAFLPRALYPSDRGLLCLRS